MRAGCSHCLYRENYQVTRLVLMIGNLQGNQVYINNKAFTHDGCTTGWYNGEG